MHFDPKALVRAGTRFIKPTGEPQRGYLWEIQILDDSINKPNFIQQTINDLNPLRSAKNIQFYAQTVTIPNSSVDVITSSYLGKKKHYPGIDRSAKQVTIAFWDDQDFTVLKYFQQWHDYINTPIKGASAERDDIIRTAIIRLKDSTDLFTNLKVQLKKTFVSDISEISLSYSNTDAARYQVTLTFDTKIIGEQVSEHYLDGQHI